MRKWKISPLIALCIVGSLVAGFLLGRNVWNATNNVCRCDTSGHKVSFVTVEPGVQLEVLDWGGTGQTLILLTAIGDNATCSMSLPTSSTIVFMSSASRVE